MITVYGQVPEFFDTQEMAVAHFNPNLPTKVGKNYTWVIIGVCVIATTFLFYQHMQYQKLREQYDTI